MPPCASFPVDGDRVVVCASNDPLDVDVVAIRRDGSVEVLASGGGVRSASVGGGVLAVSVSDLDGSRLAVGEHLVDSFTEEPVVDPAPIFHVVGERDLRAAVLFPTVHDGSLLPVLLDPYGGPHAQRVQRVRGQFLTSQWFADQGFAVVVVDGRGTPGRGPALERAVRGHLAGPVLDDQVDAAARGITETEAREARTATVPAGRFGTADEFGAACAWLCSDKAGFVIGQNILLDGGAFPGAM